MKNEGLFDFHVYTLLAVAEVEDCNGYPAKIVKIRNPYGNNEWNGDWSDQSNLWSESAKN